MSAQPEAFTYFTDRDLGRRFPAILREAGLSVEEHAAHFKHDTPDEEWLAVVGQRGWIAVTHDGRIRYKANERAAVMANGVGLLIVGKGKFPDLAALLVRTHPAVLAFVTRTPPPFIAKLRQPPLRQIRKDPLASGWIEKAYP